MESFNWQDGTHCYPPEMPEVETLSLHSAWQFAEKYANAKSEKQLAQSFWHDFFVTVCNIDDLLSAGIEFEYPVKSLATNNTQFIDVLWPGILLIEHKSAGKSLDKAEEQARDYLVSLDSSKRAPTFIVSDFARIRIVDVFAGTSFEFKLEELPSQLHRLEALLNRFTQGLVRVETTADAHAAQLMSNLFVEFEKAGYTGHAVSVFLVRLLFLVFGDDTRMWRRTNHGLFEQFVSLSLEDGMGLGASIQELFQVLDTPKAKRPTSLPKSLVDFPYINGSLFSEPLPIFSFTAAMRKALYEACQYDWSKISPAIFGAMFQTIKSKEARREMGEHYTSETNILKVIGPLFLSTFNEKLPKAWDSPAALKKFHQELGTYSYLDPACGCGNFLVVAYKRLRELELKLIARLQNLEGRSTKLSLDGSSDLKVHLNQFHGIECEEWPSQIATVAMFLTDHQANLEMEEITGLAPERFPLIESAKISHGNALTVKWNEVCPMSDKTFIFGNPPFTGSTFLQEEQRKDMAALWGGVSGTGILDYVSNWLLLAGSFSNKYGIHAGFITTNSISQGQQPPIIWERLYSLGVGIDFAHRTFAWENDSAGKAAVHCVIIGLSNAKKSNRLPLWSYPTPKSSPVLTYAHNINAYLLDAPNVLIKARRTPITSNIQVMDNGSKPTDAGFLSNLSAPEADEIKSKDPIAAKYLRRIVGAQELIHNELRYCLWLQGVDPSDLRNSLELVRRVSAVRSMREASVDKATKKDANRPYEFQKIRQPSSSYLAIPLLSSEDRDYVPLAMFSADVIANNLISVVPNASLLTFGILSSRPFNAWNKAVSGRLKNDTRISNTITYNNFPFPSISEIQAKLIEAAAEEVLEARKKFPDASLADLYNRNGMPQVLRVAHRKLDRSVLAVFGLAEKATDKEILERLFSAYSEMTGNLFSDAEMLRKKPLSSKK